MTTTVGTNLLSRNASTIVGLRIKGERASAAALALWNAHCVAQALRLEGREALTVEARAAVVRGDYERAVLLTRASHALYGEQSDDVARCLRSAMTDLQHLI